MVNFEQETTPLENQKELLISIEPTEEAPKTEEISQTGEVISIKDGIAFVSRLDDLKVGELVEFSQKNIFGMALNLETDQVGCIVFGNESAISQGDSVLPTNRLVTVPVGNHLLGRVVNGLGQFIDGKEETEGEGLRFNVERKAPGVITRLSVAEPLLTGYKIVDSLLPIGRGRPISSLILMSPLCTRTTLCSRVSAQHVTRRYMHRTPPYALRLTLTKANPAMIHERARHCLAIRIKKKTQAVNDLASDETGKHPHVVNAICVKPDCETKKCPKLCDVLCRWDVLGHLTHKPPTTKPSVFVSQTDINGQPKDQSFVPNTDPTKQATAAQVNTYQQNQEVTFDAKADQYIKIPANAIHIQN